MKTSTLLALLVSAMLVSTSQTQAAIINIANGKPVIGGNSDYSAGDFNTGGAFATSHVTNGLNASPDNNTGSITEGFGDNSYWLGRQGNSAGYFVLDLGALYAIGDIELFNTRNGTALDRGTGNFTIKASLTAADTFTSVGWDLTGAIATIASGTLSAQTISSPLTSQPFVSSSNFYFRYIRFDALSIASVNPPQGVGLNEIRLFASSYPIPEPSTFALMGMGLFGLAVRRRRQTCVR